MNTFGPTFTMELETAGLTGLPLVWGSDGEVTGREFLTNEQRAALDTVVAAHDPEAVPPPKPALAATKLGLKRALAEIDRWEEVRTLIEADPVAAEDWSLAIEINRTDPMFQRFVSAGAFSEAELDAVFQRARDIVL